MPTYHYTAINDTGQTVRGRIEAASTAALEGLLKRKGQWLATVEETRSGTRAAPRGKGNARVPRRILVEFFLSLSLQLRSGISLIQALTFGLEEAAAESFQAVQADLIERVKAGSTFSDALRAHPRTFSTFLINLVHAGETSGRLAETCDEIRRHLEWTDRLLADVRQAIFYPAFVLVASTAFFFIVFTFLIPRFAGVLKELNVPLPGLTRVMLDLSAFMQGHILLVLAALLTLGTAAVLGPRLSRTVATLFDTAKLRAPVFGSIIRIVCMSRFAQNLATLYRSGIPLLDALRLARPLVGNKVVEEAVDEIHSSVNAGRSLHDALRDQPVFPRLIVQMVAVGEGSGKLDEALQHVADYYNEIVPRAVKRLFSVMEPLMILGLIVMVGTVALAVILPIASALGAR